MSKTPPAKEPVRQKTFKQADVGQALVLSDSYIVANNQTKHLQAIAMRTMQMAEQKRQETLDATQSTVQQIIDNAHARAAQIIAEEGEAQRDAILNQGYEEGFQAGFLAGEIQIRDEMAQELKTAMAVLSRAFEAEKLLAQQFQTRQIKIMQSVLQHVLGEELQTRPEQFQALLEKAVDAIHWSGAARVRLNPDMLKSLLASSPDLEAQLAEKSALTFAADVNCGRYEVYLETLEGAYDLSATSQVDVYLHAIESELQTALNPDHLLTASSETEPDGTVSEGNLLETTESKPILSETLLEVELTAEPES